MEPRRFFVELTQMLCASGEGGIWWKKAFFYLRERPIIFFFLLGLQKNKPAMRKVQRVVPKILTAGFIVMSAFGRL